MGFSDRIKHGWNAFMGRDQPNSDPFYQYGYANYSKPDRIRLSVSNERSILASILNKIAIDVAGISIQHVRVDANDRYLETINSPLNNCFKFEANLDQAATAFKLDIVMSLMDEGCIAIVPTSTSKKPNDTGGYDIFEMRVAKIIEWYPSHVKTRVYNEYTGKYDELVYDKRTVAIVENPLYSIMNEPNSTLRRLSRKLSLLDKVDEQSSSGKLDIIIQLPFTTHSDVKKRQAEERRKSIEMQLEGSKYGIAYIDGTERVTQLNRPAENNLLTQVNDLTKDLFSQLGMTEGVFYGTASEEEMLNYHNRSVAPFLVAITEACMKAFLSKTARTQGQRIMFFRDPFQLVPVSQIADIADKFTRNEILSSNEVRAIVGYKPVDDLRANELRNKNLNASDNQETSMATTQINNKVAAGERFLISKLNSLKGGKTKDEV